MKVIISSLGLWVVLSLINEYYSVLVATDVAPGSNGPWIC